MRSPTATAPTDLVFVRHGQSEANIINRAADNGDPSLITAEFKARHDSQNRLTSLGIEQAKATGQWIRQEIGTEFNRYITSPYIRAIETAGHLGMKAARGWEIDDLASERSWGQYAGLSLEDKEKLFSGLEELKAKNRWEFIPPGGDSLGSGTRFRHHQLVDGIGESERGLIVSHGEYLWVARFVLERMNVAGWIKAHTDESQQIQNGMVLQYTSVDPENPNLTAEELRWVRAVCPWDETKSINSGDWQEIEQRFYTEEELLVIAQEVPRLQPD